MEEMVKVRVDAPEAGIDASCLPLDKGAQDLVALVLFQMEKAGKVWSTRILASLWICRRAWA